MKPGKRGPARQRGIAYLGVLLLVAALGLTATEAARVWKTVQQRDREAQLLFVGGQIRQAIASYYNSAEGSRFPATLDELVDDRRGPRPLRHLRRVYADPLTGTAEWGVVASPEGGVMGVYSQAEGRPLKRRGFADGDAEFEDKDTYAEWVFVYLPPAQDAPGGAGDHGGAPPGAGQSINGGSRE
jgi:type II secretory pathway pseudopilin PulG